MMMKNEFKTGWSKVLKTSHLLVVASMFGLAACAQKNDSSAFENVDVTEPVDQLYNQALANISAGNVNEGRRKLEAVDKQHPNTDFAEKSEVLLVFTHYRTGAYGEAIKQGKRFLRRRATHPESDYIQYLIGMANYRQIPDVTRDQTYTQRTVEAMEKVVKDYPDSEYVDDAKTKIRFARDQLAGKDMQVGRYYLERKEYLAAIKRFRNVVEKYQNTRHIEESLARLTEAYYAIGLTSEAQTAAAILGHNFPDSSWYKDSYNLLATGGLEPRENKGSWISRAGKLITGKA